MVAKRLMVGFLKGTLIAVLVAVALVHGLGLLTLGGWLAYLLAVALGAFVGLVAGKPIWSRGAGIEAGLKSFFGALLAAGMMFALRRWVNVEVDLGSLGLGQGSIAELSVTSLPAIALLLSVLFELDNTPDGSSESAPGPDAKRRLPELESSAEMPDIDASDAGAEAKRARRSR